MQSLNEMIDEFPDDVPETFTVDLSDLYKQAPETKVFTFKIPDVVTLHRVAEDSARYQEKFPIWSQSLCYTTALLALCHVSPKPEKESVGALYTKLTKKRLVWTRLETTFNQKRVAYDLKLIADAKND